MRLRLRLRHSDTKNVQRKLIRGKNTFLRINNTQQPNISNWICKIDFQWHGWRWWWWNTDRHTHTQSVRLFIHSFSQSIGWSVGWSAGWMVRVRCVLIVCNKCGGHRTMCLFGNEAKWQWDYASQLERERACACAYVSAAVSSLVKVCFINHYTLTQCCNDDDDDDDLVYVC